MILLPVEASRIPGITEWLTRWVLLQPAIELLHC